MFEPLHFIADIPQEQIAACPTVTGMAPTGKWIGDLPPAARRAIRGLPWAAVRKFRQVLVRPQDCRAYDSRLGTFWHRDVDVHGHVTPTWDDMILTVVSFGGIAETEFIDDREIDAFSTEGAPSLDCYTDETSRKVNERAWSSQSLAPCQVGRYRSPDWHRAGYVRKHGWRLVLIGIESDYLEPRGAVVPRR